MISTTDHQRALLDAFRRTYGIEAELGFGDAGEAVIHVTSDPGARPLPAWYGGIDVRCPSREFFLSQSRARATGMHPL